MNSGTFHKAFPKIRNDMPLKDFKIINNQIFRQNIKLPLSERYTACPPLAVIFGSIIKNN
jgi:hypothetical protein